MGDSQQPLRDAVTPSQLSSIDDGGSLRVSLMPAEVAGERPIDVRKRLVISSVGLASLFLLLLAGNFVLAYQVSKREAAANQLRQQILQTEDAIKEKRQGAARVANFQRQMDTLAESLDQHAYWTGFFTFIESNTLPTVRFRNFNGDLGGGVFTVDALAANYREAALQLVHLRNLPEVLQVRTGSLTLALGPNGENEGVSFTMTVKVKPDAWAKPSAASTTPDASVVGVAPPIESPVELPLEAPFIEANED